MKELKIILLAVTIVTTVGFGGSAQAATDADYIKCIKESRECYESVIASSDKALDKCSADYEKKEKEANVVDYTEEEIELLEGLADEYEACTDEAECESYSKLRDCFDKDDACFEKLEPKDTSTGNNEENVESEETTSDSNEESNESAE